MLRCFVWLFVFQAAHDVCLLHQLDVQKVRCTHERKPFGSPSL